MPATMATQKIKLNSTVRWTSSSGGFTSEKEGKVVAIVPANENPFDKISNKLARECTFRFRGNARDHRSYLVRVPRGEGKMDYLYCPLVRDLQLIS